MPLLRKVRSSPRGLTPILVMVLTSCGASPRVELRPWPPEVGVVPTETFGEDATADIAVLLDEGHVRFLDPKRPHEGYTLDWIFRFRVLTPAGRYAASRRTALTPGDRLLSLSARSYAPGQPRSLRELRPEDVRIVAAASGSILLYRGAATVAFEVPGVEVGDVVEVRGRLRRNHLYRLPTWSFDGISPVKKSRFVVHVPPGWELTWASRRGRNRVDFAPRRTPEQGATMWVFEAESLPPLRPEPGAPSLGALTVQLAVRQAPGRDGLDRFGTWDAIAEFYRRLVDRQSGLTEQDWQAVVRELGSRPSPEALYAYVRDRVRYVALFDDDLGGFQPHPAHDVLTKRYGDCKDQSTLLVSLLNRVGVAAYPMLVGTRDRVFFDAEFPSVSAFNHVVVAVPRPDGKYIFLDPTDIEGEYGLLSHYLQGQGALIVRSGDSELLELPAPQPHHHVTRAHYRVESPTRIQADIELTGVAAWGLDHLAQHDRAKLEEVIVDRFLGHFEGVRVDNLELSGKVGSRQVSLRAVVAPWADESETYRAFPLAGFLPGRLLDDPLTERQRGIRLARRGVWAITVEVPATDGTELPAGGEALSPQSEFRWSSRRSGEGVKVTAELRVKDTIVPPQDLSGLRRVDEALARARASVIVTRLPR